MRNFSMTGTTSCFSWRRSNISPRALSPRHLKLRPRTRLEMRAARRKKREGLKLFIAIPYMFKAQKSRNRGQLLYYVLVLSYFSRARLSLWTRNQTEETLWPPIPKSRACSFQNKTNHFCKQRSKNISFIPFFSKVLFLPRGFFVKKDPLSPQNIFRSPDPPQKSGSSSRVALAEASTGEQSGSTFFFAVLMVVGWWLPGLAL